MLAAWLSITTNIQWPCFLVCVPMGHEWRTLTKWYPMPWPMQSFVVIHSKIDNLIAFYLWESFFVSVVTWILTDKSNYKDLILSPIIFKLQRNISYYFPIWYSLHFTREQSPHIYLKCVAFGYVWRHKVAREEPLYFFIYTNAHVSNE